VVVAFAIAIGARLVGSDYARLAMRRATLDDARCSFVNGCLYWVGSRSG
jgi:hypothetical protein